MIEMTLSSRHRIKKFEPWRSEAEHATSRSRRLPIILTFTRGWGRNIFVSFKPPRPGTEPRALAGKAAVLTTTQGPPPLIWRIKAVSSRIGTSYSHAIPCSSSCPERLQYSLQKKLGKYLNPRFQLHPKPYRWY